MSYAVIHNLTEDLVSVHSTREEAEAEARRLAGDDVASYYVVEMEDRRPAAGRSAAMSPEDKLLEAIFGSGQDRPSSKPPITHPGRFSGAEYVEDAPEKHDRKHWGMVVRLHYSCGHSHNAVLGVSGRDKESALRLLRSRPDYNVPSILMECPTCRADIESRTTIHRLYHLHRRYGYRDDDVEYICTFSDEREADAALEQRKKSDPKGRYYITVSEHREVR